MFLTHCLLLFLTVAACKTAILSSSFRSPTPYSENNLNQIQSVMNEKNLNLLHKYRELVAKSIIEMPGICELIEVYNNSPVKSEFKQEYGKFKLFYVCLEWN